ncbi:helix-turn-helix domain-containing protein [Paenibacillus sp. EZ-K15]|uniref:helix-turn-helix domain-containing protein n=1 Tax=Paenibacillus sp. EZ-K15 TaxID=2044275 RepID=UPI00137B049B|nr:helix-turn-helix domain-containing protein [Paenibacillus sp. EZ-K15]
MNVLVVDDQYDVVQGVIAGVNWQELHIDHVYPAYGPDEVRTLLNHHHVHIMLCDIEMPLENGLELFKWVKAQFPAIECIFLSSYSEFEYAQEAIQLGCFDYILQPARYEDIQASIERAIHKIHANTHMRQIYEYGAYWRQNEELLLENCVRSFMLDSRMHPQQLLRDLSNIHISVSAHAQFGSILIQLTNSNPNIETIKYELRSIVSKLIEPYNLDLLFVQLDQVNYLTLLYTEGVFDAPISELMKQFIDMAQNELGCSAACYISDIGEPEKLKLHYKALCHMRQQNVALYSKVFTMQHLNKIKDSSYSFPNMQNWSMLISHNSIKNVRDQIHSYLLQQKQLGIMSAEFLARFHQDFIQIFLTAVNQLKLEVNDIFFEQYPYADYIEAYTSLDKMIDLVHFTLDYVQEHAGEADHALSPIERAIDYINQNIEKNFSRAEVAEAIYLNPEYLSRLFKKAKGISLNDFIITRKMEISKSLLMSTHIPVHLIASKVGYSNFSYFSQVFKKHCGLTPLEYRQQQG